MTARVLRLRIGDLLADADGVLGKVVSFKVDGAIESRGAVLVEGSR